jgi:capsular exopolysaccharide synthesis family protein
MAMLSGPTRTAEGYQTLRANLMFGLPEAKVICLTSAGSGGTGTLGVNLAVALSQAAQSVILIDGNLHKPELSEALNLSGLSGLDDVLTGTSTYQDAIEFWSPGGISVLSPKLSTPNSSEILSTETFTKLIDELRGLYSYVVITTLPSLNSTDAAIIASRCDATLLLAECDESRIDQLEIAVTSLIQVGAPIAGVVISGVPVGEVNSWRAAHISNP